MALLYVDTSSQLQQHSPGISHSLTLAVVAVFHVSDNPPYMNGDKRTRLGFHALGSFLTELPLVRALSGITTDVTPT